MSLLLSVPFLSRGRSFPDECWEGELSSQHCHPGIPLHRGNFHVKLGDVITFGLFCHYWVMVLVLLLIVGIKSECRGILPETPGQVCEIYELQQPPKVLSHEWISAVLSQSEAVNHSSLSCTEASIAPESSTTRNLPMIHAGSHPSLHQHRPWVPSWGAILALRGLLWRLVLWRFHESSTKNSLRHSVSLSNRASI